MRHFLSRQLRPAVRNLSIKILFCLCCIAVFQSCSSQERVIGGSQEEWRLILAVGTDIQVVNQPTNKVSTETAYSSANNGKQLPGEVTAMEEYLTYIFLVIPSARTIEVIDNQTFKSVATISTGTRVPVGICVANSSTAYVANNDSTVTILDMTVWQYLDQRSIIVGKRPVAIKSLGNQVVVCNQESNTISVIDTRTNLVARTLSVAANPSLLVADGANTAQMIVVSLGAGKGVDVTSEKSPAVVTFYNTLSGQIVSELTLQSPLETIDSKQILPLAAAQAPQLNLLYVAIDGGFIQINTSTFSTLGFSDAGTYTKGFYNKRRRYLVFVNQLQKAVLAINGEDAVEIARNTLPTTCTAAIAL